MMSAASAIKKIRTRLCMQQNEFAQELGITPTSIMYYEMGKRTPRFPLIRKMLKLAKDNNIDVTVEDFLDEEKE